MASWIPSTGSQVRTATHLSLGFQHFRGVPAPLVTTGTVGKSSMTHKRKVTSNKHIPRQHILYPLDHNHFIFVYYNLLYISYIIFSCRIRQHVVSCRITVSGHVHSGSPMASNRVFRSFSKMQKLQALAKIEI